MKGPLPLTVSMDGDYTASSTAGKAHRSVSLPIRTHVLVSFEEDVLSSVRSTWHTVEDTCTN